MCIDVCIQSAKTKSSVPAQTKDVVDMQTMATEHYEAVNEIRGRLR